jgi:hypothetical protein
MVFSSVLESSSYFSGVLFSSRAFLALRWMMHGMILGEVASHVGVDVGRLAYPLHRPMARSFLVRGLGLSDRRCPVLSLW